MKTAFFSKYDAIHLVPDNTAALISITAPQERTPRITSGYYDSLIMKFEDSTEIKQSQKIITYRDASLIANFIKQCINNGVEYLYIHSEKGTGRSVAVCAAIQDVLRIPCEKPTGELYNKLVYQLVKEQLVPQG